MRRLSRSLLLHAVVLILFIQEAHQCSDVEPQESINGWMLQRHIYRTMMADMGLLCLYDCHKDDRCQSFNYVFSLHMCEFSNRTKEARPEDFVPDSDRYYFRRDKRRVALGSIPALAAESCKEIKASEKDPVSGKYWFSTIKPGMAVFAHCDMKTGDVDECTASSSACDVNAICNNTLGSYHCTCKLGFYGDGKTCIDVDECTASSPVCDVNAICNNTLGSYLCTCKTGFSGDGRACIDIDECNASQSVCDSNATCHNNQGSYQCSCKAGFIGDGQNCTAAPECYVYTLNNETDRSVTAGAGDKCDNTLTTGWYRFNSTAGSKMPTQCVPFQKCNTRTPGWLNGTHPTPQDGIVTRTVCFTRYGDCCRFQTSIKVRNCGSFYVYTLVKRPHCTYRYCVTK